MREKIIPGILLFSGMACFIWIIGLAWTLQDYIYGAPATPIQKPTPPPVVEQAPIAEDGSFYVLALGDSLTRGAGDSAGKGYVGYMVDQLKDKTDQEIILNNRGIDGLTSSQLALQIEQADIQAQVKRAEVIVLSIGGNNLFLGGQTLFNVSLAQELQLEFAEQLGVILTKLRALNSTATIYLIGLYNPFIEMRDPEITSKIVRNWNYQAAETAAGYPKTILVPTFDLFQMNVQDYLFTDQFHPNAEGYRLIGERVAGLITW